MLSKSGAIQGRCLRLGYVPGCWCLLVVLVLNCRRTCLHLTSLICCVGFAYIWFSQLFFNFILFFIFFGRNIIYFFVLKPNLLRDWFGLFVDFFYVVFSSIAPLTSKLDRFGHRVFPSCLFRHGVQAMTKAGMSRSKIVAAVSSANLEFRSGQATLFKWVEKEKVPLLIFSAGLRGERSTRFSKIVWIVGEWGGAGTGNILW